MTAQKNTYWFVEPLDAFTNEVIARALASLSQVEENVSLEDKDGVEHSVFQLQDHSFITRLYKDKQKFSLRFQVYFKYKPSSPLRLWTFEENKRKKVTLPKSNKEREANKKLGV